MRTGKRPQGANHTFNLKFVFNLININKFIEIKESAGEFGKGAIFEELLAGWDFARGWGALEDGGEDGFNLFSVGGAAIEIGGKRFSGLEGRGAVEEGQSLGWDDGLRAAGAGNGILREIECLHEGNPNGPFLDKVNAADGLLVPGRGIPGFGFFSVVVEERRIGLENFGREIRPDGLAAFVFLEQTRDGENRITQLLGGESANVLAPEEGVVRVG